MNHTATHHSPWALNGTIAELRCGPLSACLDVARPDLGLQHVKLNARRLTGHLLAVSRHGDGGASKSPWPLPLADAYIRGDDLVATYQPGDDWPYSPQLYWSVPAVNAANDHRAALSLLISVETHLLDTWPQITVGSLLACQELLQADPGAGTTRALKRNDTVRPLAAPCCVLHRLAELPISYAEIVPANDFRELVVRQEADTGYRAEWQLFADFLEKGVIRRARLQSVFLSRTNDLQLANAYCSAMEQRPLPLTT